MADLENSLRVIQRHKSGGFLILCYADHVTAWPLRDRCRVLLAGAKWLLDSSLSDFAAELAKRLRNVLDTEKHRKEEDRRIKAQMWQLGVIGESPVMLSVFRWVSRVAQLSDLTTLLVGETGTGKELLARAIHRLDPKRSRGPFVAVNCNTVTQNLAESELFGHRSGAFTGAVRDRRGLFRAANGGVLFLDEVADLEPTLQGKLLRVLQEGCILSVGDDLEVPVNVRVIAATNRRLEEMVSNGKFREDLFQRLNILSLRIPPLRERPVDLLPLVEYFLERHGGLCGGRVPAVGEDFLDALREMGPPGNARQVENIVRQALVRKEDDGPLSLADLPSQVWESLAGTHSPSAFGPSPLPSLPAGAPTHATDEILTASPSELTRLAEAAGWSLPRSLQHCERLLLKTALQRTRGNQAEAARLLGITPRSVYNKLRKYHLPQ